MTDQTMRTVYFTRADGAVATMIVRKGRVQQMSFDFGEHSIPDDRSYAGESAKAAETQMVSWGWETS